MRRTLHLVVLALALLATAMPATAMPATGMPATGTAAVATRGGAGIAPPPGGWSTLVDPFIGTFAPGFTNPGPVLPHGLVGAGPDTAEGPLNYGGYYVNNALISGFSHTHMSAGVFHGGHIPVMPVVGDVDAGVTPNPAGAPIPAYASTFDRASEVAEPGWYAVDLLAPSRSVELTATTRTALHRYTFGPDAVGARHVVVDVGRSLRGLHPSEVALSADGTTLTGVVRTEVAGPMPVSFALRTDVPLTWSVLGGAAIGPGGSAAGEDRVAVLGTLPAGTDRVSVAVGISYTDVAGALANLHAELPGFDVDGVRAAADAAWEAALGRIEVAGGSPLDRTRLYTALYHAQLFPSIHSDVDGRYRGPDGQVHRDGARPHYSQFSLWDSKNGQGALQAVIDPDAYRDMLHSLADFADQRGGVLPRWQLGPNDPGYMSGDPVIPFIAEGWCRGLVDADLAGRLEAQMRTLVARRNPAWHELGYLPVPHAPMWEQLDGGPRVAGTTLELGLADFALALMTGDEGLVGSSLAHRHLLDPGTGFIRPRDAGGAFLPDFAPELGYGFQEGTSWQYSWLAAHDYGGLLDAMAASGSALGPEEKLDVLFGLPASGTVPVLWPKVQNQATAFGTAYYGNQYAPGNEHDLQAPFAYAWLGVPWKTQAVTRAATSLFTPTPDGLPGNDDLGALSGWLVWAMIGLAPAVPGAPGYVVASPSFETVVIHRPGVGDLTVTAEGAGPVNRFVQSASLEGPWVTEADLAGETRLDFAMGPAPSGWGAGVVPPSASRDALATWGCATPA
jgi:predicted alpha-1,2-mannosidase